MPGLRVADLPASERRAAAAVLARGMRDNPLHVAAYGPSPERREATHRRLMTAFLRSTRHDRPIGVWRDGRLVACAGAVSDGRCRPGIGRVVVTLPTLARLGPGTAIRVGRWARAWLDRDPDTPHVHLGPLAVDRDLQGRGIGSLLLAEHCRRLDASGSPGYLETDRPENVRFYARQGYDVVGEACVIGVRCWFMWREPRR
ncbi:MAG: GNAT family N-acetyltransferase [Solirubrobacteraceae bacterium]|nr:GNAT family N-acetyltransferase [Solirubrobacteraceae bacterium]